MAARLVGQRSAESDDPNMQSFALETPIRAVEDLKAETGAMNLPANLDAERRVLVLLRQDRYRNVAAILDSSDFAIETHRRIYGRMAEQLLTPKDVSEWLRVSIAWVLDHARGHERSADLFREAHA